MEFVFGPIGFVILGLCVGSFLNVVVHRLPLMLERRWLIDSAEMTSDAVELARASGWSDKAAGVHAQWSRELSQQLQSQPHLSLASPRSRCPHCARQLGWRENIPVLGWLLLRGRCAGCKTPISAQYPIVEAATAAVFGILAAAMGVNLSTLAWCFFSAALIALTLIDAKTMLLPDVITLPLVWAGIALAWLEKTQALSIWGVNLGWNVSLVTSVLGAALGYLSLWSLYWLFKLTTGREGMGYGDFKLLAAIGAWLGPLALAPVAVTASLLGIVYWICSRRRQTHMPFGPFLAAAAVIWMLAQTAKIPQII